MKKRISQHGVTLVELLIVIAILTIIAGIGMYGFRETRLKANLREGARILSGDLMAARTAARTRGEAVTVALAINDRSYLVYADGNGDNAYTTDAVPPDTPILQGALDVGVNIFSATNATFNYTSMGMLGQVNPNIITLTSRDETITIRYQITLSMTGQVKVEKSDNGAPPWSKAW